MNRILLRNVVWNALGTASLALTGFFTAPWLIHSLGETAYGLWIILGSLAGYFGLLDLGTRAAVGYFVAFYQEQGDTAGVNRVVSTALALLGAAGLTALVGMLCLRPYFHLLFRFPAEQAADVYQALALVAVTLALTLVSNGIEAVLWGGQRFDLLNAVDIAAAIARLGLTIALVAVDPRLTTVAYVNLGITTVSLVLKITCCRLSAPLVRPAWSLVSGATIRELFGYSSWTFLDGCAQTAKAQLGPLLVGALISVALVTPYSVATRLVALMASLMIAFTGVLTPFVTGLYAQGKHEAQERVFLVGGRLCLTVSLLLAGGLCLLGKTLIILWVGTALEDAATLLTILVAGELVRSSQFVTGSVLLARRQVRALAFLGVAETTAVVLLMVVLVPWLGLAGACWALALPAIGCRGLGMLRFGCRVMGVSGARYLRECVLPALLGAILPVGLLAVTVHHRPPQGWWELVGYSAGYVAVFAAVCLPLMPSLGGTRDNQATDGIDATHEKAPFVLPDEAALRVEEVSQ